MQRAIVPTYVKSLHDVLYIQTEAFEKLPKQKSPLIRNQMFPDSGV